MAAMAATNPAAIPRLEASANNHDDGDSRNKQEHQVATINARQHRHDGKQEITWHHH